jgi:hypothetical protein
MAVQSALRTGWPLFIPQEVSCYSFLLEAESTPGHSAAGKIRSIEKSNNLIGNRTCDFSACIIVPQPTTLPRDPRWTHLPDNMVWIKHDAIKSYGGVEL